MKKLLFILVALVALSGSAFAQTYFTNPVGTENVRNTWSPFTGTASQDTISTTAGTVKYLVAINVNTAVASDSIFVWETTNAGTKYIARIIVPATAAPATISLPVNVAIDSSYVVIKRYKTSDVTLVWRKAF